MTKFGVIEPQKFQLENKEIVNKLDDEILKLYLEFEKENWILLNSNKYLFSY